MIEDARNALLKIYPVVRTPENRNSQKYHLYVSFIFAWFLQLDLKLSII